MDLSGFERISEKLFVFYSLFRASCRLCGSDNLVHGAVFGLPLHCVAFRSPQRDRRGSITPARSSQVRSIVISYGEARRSSRSDDRNAPPQRERANRALRQASRPPGNSGGEPVRGYDLYLTQRFANSNCPAQEKCPVAAAVKPLTRPTAFIVKYVSSGSGYLGIKGSQNLGDFPYNCGGSF